LFLTFVVVGGGYSGVETAGQISDLLRNVHRFYPRLDPKEFRLVLVHNGPCLLPQMAEKYGPVVEKQPREWHKFESKPYHLEIHFYKDKADAITYLNWVGQPTAFAKDEIEKLLQRSSAARWSVVDDSPEATMFVVKGFTGIHMKLDHILIVATDGSWSAGPHRPPKRKQRN
jgi:hypothetical protein